jgi:two-component system cell cycle response regulator DivK
MARILLVEDNEMNRDMLSRRLIRRGHDVTMALDGPAGIAAATTNRPDLILMDISLPGMDGWEATKVLRSQAETASIPIIALTAHAMETDRQRSLEVGCNDFDTKPVDLARLLLKIEALLATEP